MTNRTQEPDADGGRVLQAGAGDGQSVIPEAPLAVTGARVLLVVLIAVWVFGAFTGAGGVLALTWSIGLAVAGVFAFWAVGRRRPIGRWVAVGLFGIVIYRTVSPLLYAWRAANGDLEPPGALVAYSSPEEAKGALGFSLVLFVVMGAQTFLLARGKAANRYFGSSAAPEEALHTAGQTGGRSEDLLKILRIGHDTSIRGAGLSLRKALRRTRYRELRAGFQESDLLALLKTHPSIVDEWFSYCEDKRTSGGWYVRRNGQVGQVDGPAAMTQFPSTEEAIAGYVVRELDFWANIGSD